MKTLNSYSKFLAVFAVLGLLLAPSAMAADGDFSSVRDLIPGKKGDPIGTVTTVEEGGFIKVTYEVTSDDWCMTEVHTYVSNAIPQHHAPGQFPYQAGPLGCAKTHEIADAFPVPAGDFVYVAAHAVVVNPDLTPLYDNDPGDLDRTVARIQVFHFTDATNPMPVGDPSYWDAFIDTNFDGQLDFALDAWCIDLDRQLATGNAYPEMRLYSSLDPDIDALTMGQIKDPENLDKVNYVLNQYHTSSPASPYDTATINEVQWAIWVLMGEMIPMDLPADADPVVILNIVSDANANGEGYVPPQDGVIGIIGYQKGVQTIILVVPTGMALGEETAWAKGNFEFKSSWATFWVVGKESTQGTTDVVDQPQESGNKGKGKGKKK